MQGVEMMFEAPAVCANDVCVDCVSGQHSEHSNDWTVHIIVWLWFMNLSKLNNGMNTLISSGPVVFIRRR